MKANKSGGLSSEVQNFSASSEVKLEIAPLDRISKQADKAHAHEAVPMIYSRIIFQPTTKATNSPTVT